MEDQMIVTTANYSTFFDVVTDVQFTPILDMESQCMIGHARVSDEMADKYATRHGFKVLSDEDFALVTVPAEPEPVEPAPSLTGDPLLDAVPHVEPVEPATPPIDHLEGADASKSAPVTTAPANAKPAKDVLDGPPAPPKGK